jgi:hypothetical protein
MKQLRRVTATLTFLEDGLHAVLTIDRAGGGGGGGGGPGGG